MKRLLLTGATGFVGRNFIDLLHKKYSITAIVRQNSHVESIESQCEIFVYDNDISRLSSFLRNKKFDGIIHLATFYKPSHTPNDILNFIDSNITFGASILEAMSASGVDFFINTTTFSQYTHPTSDIFYPAGFYDSTKEAFVDIMQYYSIHLPTKFANLMLYNTYGKNDTRPKIFNLWKQNIQNKQTLQMSKGEQLIDITHIQDVIAGFDNLIDFLSKMTKKSSLIPNFTLENNRLSLKNLAKIYEDTLGVKLNISWGAKPYRKGEIMNPISTQISQNFTKVPNWKPTIDITDGIKKLYEK
ncbi:NAD(P)-dependent oxidoreductase [Helicobacter sp. 11S03491-1]|uniref:NAD-dependent epimerase/dehydratase family protein n=1 Tax=Helicobacter sp. 11S03491-1 TaxID=1476196 RepID=UPI000BA548CF|nr:NAD(P)-dependent oxidoreductase [Helicobacter sp. 11S03491-1]PAF41221.1 hypothetical protein BKH45_07610 [Helicobacter sp. 11S03491-1]